MARVILENISKVYEDTDAKRGRKKAIDNVSFTVEDKEFMVIVGPSGCGKSTLLRMIAGLEDITEGNLSIDGVRINELSPGNRDIAMVFQNYALYPHMTVYDNMAFGLRIKNYTKKEIKERVTQTAQLLEIEDELYRKPKTLSGGQRQRVAIGRAIIRRPKVFLFDEPLSNLDAKLRSQMRIELQKLHREINATMIYVTHDQTEAMTLGNRIAVLNKGNLMQLDTPMHLYSHPANKFVAGFIGSPAMNFIKGLLIEKENTYFIEPAPGCNISLGNQLLVNVQSKKGQEIEIGIRPENIIIGNENQSGAAKCEVEVMAFENMGNEQLIYLSFPGHNIIARNMSQKFIEIGDKFSIQIPEEGTIYLDPSSGEIIE